MRNIWIALLIVLIIGLAGLTWYIVGVNEEIPVVDTIIVRPDTLDQEIVTTGNLVAKDRQELYGYTAGKIARIHVREGDQVKVGQLVLEMDTGLYDVQIEQAEAGVETAQANLQLALQKRNIAMLTPESEIVLDELDNIPVEPTGSENLIPTVDVFMPQIPSTLDSEWKALDTQASLPALIQEGQSLNLNPETPSPELLQQLPKQFPQPMHQMPAYPQSISRAVAERSTALTEKQALVNQAEVGVKQAQAALKQAQATLKAAKLQREQLRLKAAIDGTVTAVNAKEGSQVSMQSPLLVIADLSTLGVKAALNELDGAKVKAGQEVIISSAALGSKTIKGVVEKVGLEALAANAYQSTGSRVVNVDVKLTEKADELKPGFSVDLKIVLASKQGVLAVPYECLFQEGKKTFVYTVNEGKLVKTEVIPGTANDTKQEILQGLNEGDRVVLSPIPSYYEGMEVFYH